MERKFNGQILFTNKTRIYHIAAIGLKIVLGAHTHTQFSRLGLSYRMRPENFELL